ncbi:hypothetical protein ACNKHL_09960 [Shigella flexneri]
MIDLGTDVWVSDGVLRRLRLRSLQAAEQRRVPCATTYARLLLERRAYYPPPMVAQALFASTSQAFMRAWVA